MASIHRLLIINPGSTSTKIAIYENETPRHVETLRHSSDEIGRFTRVFEQYAFRRDIILKWMESVGVEPGSLAAVVGRGGLLRPIPGGTYQVNQAMLDDLKGGQRGEHASNLGAALAFEIAARAGIPAFVVDPVVVDEMQPLARISGLPEMPRQSIFHALNQKAVARRAAADLGKRYQEVNLIVVHLGGGVSVGAHRQGQVIDVNNGLDGEGPMSPERAGSVPPLGLVNLAFSWQYTQPELARRLVGKGGFVAHLGTNDARNVEERALSGNDPEAELVFKAMAYQVAQEIGRAAVTLEGKVDRVILTGGLAYAKPLIEWIRARTEWIAPLAVYPGEDEMQALAEGGLRVLRGEERPREY